MSFSEKNGILKKSYHLFFVILNLFKSITFCMECFPHGAAKLFLSSHFEIKFIFNSKLFSTKSLLAFRLSFVSILLHTEATFTYNLYSIEKCESMKQQVKRNFATLVKLSFCKQSPRPINM